MLETIQELLTSKLEAGQKVLLSPFSSQDLLSFLITLQCKPIFFDTTLQGAVDKHNLKKVDLTDVSHFLYLPFLGYSDDKELVIAFCQQHGLEFSDLSEASVFKNNEIFQSFQEYFSKSKDFSIRDQAYDSPILPIYLEPQFFCTKEAIVLALEEAGIDLTFVKLLYKRPLYLSSFKEISLFGASECQKSFIGLPLNIDKSEADRIAKVVLEVFDRHSLRRCTF